MPAEQKRPIPLRDVFPRLIPARVREVMETPEFRARASLMDLGNELLAKKAAGVDVDRALSLWNKAYTPAMDALSESFSRLGFSSSEISAADMVNLGTITLPEPPQSLPNPQQG